MVPAPASHHGPGAQVFADAGCGSCHTLQAAGSTGTLGPNLDQLKPTRDVVAAQVKSGGGGMPSFAGQALELRRDRRGRGVRVAARRRATRCRRRKASSRTTSCSRLARPATPPATCRRSGTSPTARARRRPSPSYARRWRPTPRSRRRATRSRTRSAPERSCATTATSARPSARATPRAAPATTTASCSGSWPASPPTRSRASRARPATTRTIRANAYDYYQCVHGLGHGLMLYTRYDLPKALDLCHQLANRTTRSRAPAASSWRTSSRRTASTRST